MEQMMGCQVTGGGMDIKGMKEREKTGRKESL